MNTDELIDALTRDVRPVRRHELSLVLMEGLAFGGAVTLTLVAVGLGLRPDLMIAIHGSAFWLKFVYCASLAACALGITVQLARSDPLRGVWWVAAPVCALAVVGAFEWVHTLPTLWLKTWLGISWKVCAALILGLSAPIFLCLCWSLRRLTPTRLRAAGAAGGLASGACAATIYCLHCPETSAVFVLTWYSLGMVLAAALGALLGPRLMRW